MYNLSENDKRIKVLSNRPKADKKLHDSNVEAEVTVQDSVAKENGMFIPDLDIAFHASSQWEEANTIIIIHLEKQHTFF
jgi:hypothetical protein